MLYFGGECDKIKESDNGISSADDRKLEDDRLLTTERQMAIENRDIWQMRKGIREKRTDKQMLHVMICDDETVSLSFLDRTVREWAAERRCEVKIKLYQSAEQFLFDREDQEEADIMLLDIDMPGLSGIDLAHRLRREEKRTQIIFVTGLSDYMLEGYDVEAVSYLLKPVDAGKLFICLDRAKERRQKEEPVLLLELPGGMARVKLAKICYLESDAHTTQVHCMRSFYSAGTEPGKQDSMEVTGGTGVKFTMRSRTGIRELEERLAVFGGGFFRIHRSYIVNLAYVNRISRREVLLDGGETLPVSRSRWEALNRAYLDYYKNQDIR